MKYVFPSRDIIASAISVNKRHKKEKTFDFFLLSHRRHEKQKVFVDMNGPYQIIWKYNL